MTTDTRILVLAALVLVGCADATSGPSATVLVPAGPSLAVTGNLWTDVAWNWTNTCGPTPEEVSLEGRLHIVFKEDGDKFEAKVTSDAFKGIGQITGTEYVFTLREQTTIVPPTSTPFTATTDARYQVISQGSADNLFTVVHFVYTNPPFEIKEFTTTNECKG